MHPHLAQAMNLLRSPHDRRMSWDAYEALRERWLMGELAASWYVCVHSGRVRLCDVPLDHRAFVYARIAHENVQRLPHER